MARYEHLPIYKAALDLTVHLEKLVAGFSRYHKYTLGTEMREGSRALLMQVLKANNAGNANQRRAELLTLRELIDALLLTMRVAKEVKAFKSFTGYLFTTQECLFRFAYPPYRQVEGSPAGGPTLHLFALGGGSGWICVQSYDYWSGTEYAPNTNNAWNFNTNNGNQNANNKNNQLYAMAVRPGG